MDKRTGWKSQAACLGRSTQNYDPWSPPDTAFHPPRVAAEICEHCPVKRECLVAGLAGDEWGVWGGLTRRQRMALKRPRKRVRCPICDSQLVDSVDHTFGICAFCGVSWQRYRPNRDQMKTVTSTIPGAPLAPACAPCDAPLRVPPPPPP